MGLNWELADGLFGSTLTFDIFDKCSKIDKVFCGMGQLRALLSSTRLTWRDTDSGPLPDVDPSTWPRVLAKRHSFYQTWLIQGASTHGL